MNILEHLLLRRKEDIIFLKPFSEVELNDTYRDWFFDPEVTRYNSHGKFPYTKKQSWDYLNENIDSKSSLIFAIYYEVLPIKKASAFKHVGNIALEKIDLENRKAEIAWIIGEKSLWGRGIATEAAKLILKHGFHKLNLNRIYGGTSANNLAMQKVFGKLGFKLEGESRQDHYEDGIFTDTYQYSLLRQDYENE